MYMDFKNLFLDHDIDNTPSFSLTGKQCLCRIVDIYDGDTAIVVFEFHEKFIKMTIRLYGLDTPEIRTLDIKEKEKGYLARQSFLDLMCPENHPLEVGSSRNDVQDYFRQNIVLGWIECFHFDKYGRLLGNIFTYNEGKIGLSINQSLLKTGCAEIYK